MYIPGVASANVNDSESHCTLNQLLLGCLFSLT